jgi:hypothetical protein
MNAQETRHIGAPIRRLFNRNVVYLRRDVFGNLVAPDAGAAANPQAVLFMERRQLPPIPSYTVNSRQTIQVDRDGVLSEIRLRLAYTVTLANTADNVGATAYALASLIRRLEIIVNGQDTVWSVTGRTLAMRQTLEQRARPLGMDATVVLTKNVATNYEIELRIPCYLPLAQRMDDCSLDLRGTNISQCILAITWGDGSDMFQQLNSATTISNVVCTLEGHYLVNLDAKKTFLVRAMDEVIQPVTATNAALQVLMDRGQDIFYRSFFTLATSDLGVAAAGGGSSGLVATNAILEGANQNVQVLAGAQVYVNREAKQVRGEQMGDPFNLTLVDQQTGVYPIWLPYLGSSQTLINTGILTADLYLKYGVTLTNTNNQLLISREAMRPLRA